VADGFINTLFNDFKQMKNKEERKMLEGLIIIGLLVAIMIIMMFGCLILYVVFALCHKYIGPFIF